MSSLNDEQLKFIEQVRNDLNEWIDSDPYKDDLSIDPSDKRSNKTVGRSISFNSSVISQFRNDKYTGNNLKVAVKLQNFLKIQKVSPTRVDDKPVFAETTIAKEVFLAIKYAVQFRKIAVIIGDAGSGKTIATEEYERRQDYALRIEVNKTVTTTSLLHKFCEKLKIPYTTGKKSNRSKNTPILFDEIVKQLDSPVIIDEGENLKLKELEILRKIHDFSRCPMLITGCEDLLSTLRRIPQLSSRVGYIKECNLLTQRDVQLILEKNFPLVSEYYDTFYSLSKKNGRLIGHLVSLVRFVMQETGAELSLELIDDASKLLMKVPSK